MRLIVLFGVVGLGLAGCNGAQGTDAANDVAAHTVVGDTTGSHLKSHVGASNAQSVGADAIYGAGGISGGANGNGPASKQ